MPKPRVLQVHAVAPVVFCAHKKGELRVLEGCATVVQNFIIGSDLTEMYLYVNDKIGFCTVIPYKSDSV